MRTEVADATGKVVWSAGNCGPLAPAVFLGGFRLDHHAVHTDKARYPTELSNEATAECVAATRQPPGGYELVATLIWCEQAYKHTYGDPKIVAAFGWFCDGPVTTRTVRRPFEITDPVASPSPPGPITPH